MPITADLPQVFILKGNRKSQHQIQFKEGIGYFLEYYDGIVLQIKKSLVSAVASGNIIGVSFYCLKVYKTKSMDFNEWQGKVMSLIVEKQKRPFANYKKNKWKANGRVLKSMFNEGQSPNIAANIWGLSHEK